MPASPCCCPPAHPAPRPHAQRSVHLGFDRWGAGVTAEASVDNVTVSAALNVAAPFGLAVSEDASFGPVPWDGMAGLALPATGRVAPPSGLIQSLTAEAGLLPVFGLYLTHDAPQHGGAGDGRAVSACACLFYQRTEAPAHLPSPLQTAPPPPSRSASELTLGCYDMALSFLGRGSQPFWVPLLAAPSPPPPPSPGAPPPPPTFDLWRVSLQRVTLSSDPKGPQPPDAALDSAADAVALLEGRRPGSGGSGGATEGVRSVGAHGVGSEALCHPSGCVGVLASSVHAALLPPPLLLRLVAMANTVRLWRGGKVG